MNARGLVSGALTVALTSGCLEFSDSGRYRCDPSRADSRDCGDGGVDGDAGVPNDAGPDARNTDAGAGDAGTVDAGVADAGGPDAGAPDGGASDGGAGVRLRWGSLAALAPVAQGSPTSTGLVVTPGFPGALGRACAPDGGVCIIGGLGP